MPTKLQLSNGKDLYVDDELTAIHGHLVANTPFVVLQANGDTVIVGTAHIVQAEARATSPSREPRSL